MTVRPPGVLTRRRWASWLACAAVMPLAVHAQGRTVRLGLLSSEQISIDSSGAGVCRNWREMGSSRGAT
jgi:hypothetical protein